MVVSSTSHNNVINAPQKNIVIKNFCIFAALKLVTGFNLNLKIYNINTANEKK